MRVQNATFIAHLRIHRAEYYLKLTSFLFKLGFQRGLNGIEQEANDSAEK